MHTYIFRRTLLIIPLLFGISLITFFVMHLAPGKPTDIVEFSSKISAESKSRLRQLYGLDKPWYVQYFQWLKRIVKFDFGKSFKDDRPVLKKIGERLPATLLLNSCSLLLILLITIPIGVFSAVHQNQWFDKFMTVLVFIGFSVPAYWLALLLMILFGLKLGWLPISGLHSLSYTDLSGIEKSIDLVKHLILPVLISSFTGLASLSRYIRAGMLDILRQDYIRTARAKGLPENRVVLVHGLRNVLIPIVTILGLSLPDLIGGSFIFETIFAWPGMGRLGFEAVMARDYPTVMGVGTIAAVLTLFGNFIADIAYAYADPRIRYK